MGEWRRHFFYTKYTVRTTWKLRVGALIVLILIAAGVRGFWTTRIANSLVCTEELGHSDVILVENFDPNYLVFERAAALQKAGLASRALVPVEASDDPGIPNPVSMGIADVMARHARLAAWHALPIREAEPISLHAALQVRDRVAREHVASIIIVAPAFRSQRTSLMYHIVLHDARMHLYCAPVFGRQTPDSWTQTWHGIQEVVLEFLKLQYYRFYVIPFLFPNDSCSQLDDTTSPCPHP